MEKKAINELLRKRKFQIQVHQQQLKILLRVKNLNIIIYDVVMIHHIKHYEHQCERTMKFNFCKFSYFRKLDEMNKFLKIHCSIHFSTSHPANVCFFFLSSGN